jgi:hypothetical protein|tara:strand:- start:12 stop:356 length:345 start_codon:yes stop_codon:yes gene_type:complete
MVVRLSNVNNFNSGGIAMSKEVFLGESTVTKLGPAPAVPPPAPGTDTVEVVEGVSATKNTEELEILLIVTETILSAASKLVFISTQVVLVHDALLSQVNIIKLVSSSKEDSTEE